MRACRFVASVLAAVCCVLLASPQRAHAQQELTGALAGEREAALDAALEEIRRRFRIKGLAVGIVENGLPRYARGFGVRDSRDGAPVTLHTQFHAASISKTLTATAVLQLAEKGRLSISDPVERYLPAFAGSGITLTHLLTHSAGLSDTWSAKGGADDAAVTRYVEDVARQERAYPPGQRWEYSDAAFNILGAVIEVASGVRYPDYMQRYVLEPAGMTESTFRHPREGADIAWPYPGVMFIRRASDYGWDRVFLPSSGLQVTLPDLMRWASVNLDRRPELLSASSYEALFTRQRDTSSPDVAMGLGWQLEKRESHWLPRHAGGDSGFRALLTLYPHARRAIVILSNSETTPRWEIQRVVEKVLAGEAIVLPEPAFVIRYPGLIGAAAAMVVIAAAIVLWRRRFAPSNPATR